MVEELNQLKSQLEREVVLNQIQKGIIFRINIAAEPAQDLPRIRQNKFLKVPLHVARFAIVISGFL